MPKSRKEHKVPKIVALEVLEKNGVDVKKLQELITKGAGAEFTTYYYTILIQEPMI
jgi:ferritin-like protein